MSTMLVSAITVLILLATMVEAALEMCKPALSKIIDEKWRTSVTILASVVIGVILAFLFQFTLLQYLPFLLLPAWAGYVFMGMLSAAGSRFWHSVLELVIKLTAMAQAKVTEIEAQTQQ